MSIRRLITNLAVVQSNYDQNCRDYLDCFVPLMATLIARKRYSRLDPDDIEKVVSDFTAEFGIKMKHYPAVSLIRRCKRIGIIHDDNGAIAIDLVRIAKYDITLAAVRFERESDALIHEVSHFCSDRYSHECTVEEVETSLALYLDEFDQDILRTSIEGVRLPTLRERKRLRYYIHSFILEAYTNKPETFERIVRVSVGHMLSSVLVARDTGEKDNAYKGKMRGVRVYLDTSFLLGLLGVDGEYRRQVCSGLVYDLLNAGAILCYCETIEMELEGVTEECRRAMGSTSDRTLRVRRIRLQRHGLSETQIQYIIANRSSILKNHSIIKEEFPDIGTNFSRYIDVKSLEKHIHAVYLENNPAFDANRELQKSRIARDISVISGIYRLRDYASPKSIAQSRAIFVTPNGGLAKASYLYEKERLENVQPIINPCVTETFIGTLIWIQQPARIIAGSSKRVLAQCYAAIQPSDQILAKYLENIDRLQKSNTLAPEEYAAAISYTVALDILQNHTLGDPDMLGEKEAEDIARETLSRIRDQAMKTEIDERRRRQEAENENTLIREHISARSHRIGRLVACTLNWVITVTFVVGMYYTTVSASRWWHYGFAFFWLVCTLLNIKRSWTIDAFTLKVQDGVGKLLNAFFLPASQSRNAQNTEEN
jgi:hypothetical protein